MKLLKKIMRGLFGTPTERFLKTVVPTVEKINSLEPDFRKLTNIELREKTQEFKERLSKGETLNQLLPEAFAAVRDAGRRFLSMRHYDVQLIGGIVLHQGKIAEMVTGEGKTLVATLAAYLNALEGKGVHVITVNDYLAQRDRDWMAPIFQGLGLSVGAIQSQMYSGDRQREYSCDITYGTANEFGFDYLRDNMKSELSLQAQGVLNYAIIDEVDSILIDEARTPLIISGSAADETEKYKHANDVVIKLGKADPKTLKNRYFEVKEKDHRVDLSEAGLEKVSELLGIENIWASTAVEWPHLIDNALRAHNLFFREKHYVIKDGEIIIVDENTGRLMEGRRWSDGLHQAIEAKEARAYGNVQIRREQRTLATITLQNYFRLYNKISGMTGTALTEEGEFFKIYKLEVVDIPTNRKLIRSSYNDIIYGTIKEKYSAIGDEISNLAAIGRPILVGTTTIERSVEISDYLKGQGFQIEENPIASDSKKRVYVLNAKATYENAMREADIVAQAGRRLLDKPKVEKELANFEQNANRKSILELLESIKKTSLIFNDAPGMVTIATNMAGRGTDILLGGNSGHFFYRYLNNEGFMAATEALKSDAADAKDDIEHVKSKKTAASAQAKKGGKGKKDGESAKKINLSDVENMIFSELFVVLTKADGLPYPMKDPAELVNEKERQAAEKVLAESLQALFPLHADFFYPDDNPKAQAVIDGLLKDYINPATFREFFEGDWTSVLEDFMQRELDVDKDLDVGQKFVTEIIRLSIPINEYLQKHLAIRKKKYGKNWDDTLLTGKWFEYALQGEKFLRESLFNKMMVLCPQFFNDDTDLNTPPEFIFSSGGWLNIRNQGGLHILGTERHEARRIDNQLRGRCGRQGDPGSSQFFLALEDDLIRIFAGETIRKMMQMTGLKHGRPIELKMLSNTVEKAQKKVEGRNFDIRKNLLEYDEVMDRQRKTIYTMRQGVLEGFTGVKDKNRFRTLRVKKSIKNRINEDEGKFSYDSWFDWWRDEITSPQPLEEHDDWEPLESKYRENYLKEKAQELVANCISRNLDNYAHYENPATSWNLKELVDWLNVNFASEIEKPFNMQEIESLAFDNIERHIIERILWEKDENIQSLSMECKKLRKTDMNEFTTKFQKDFNITFDEDETAEAQILNPRQSASFFIDKYKLHGEKARTKRIGSDRFVSLSAKIDEVTGGWNLPGLISYLEKASLFSLNEKDFAGMNKDEAFDLLIGKIKEKYEKQEQEMTSPNTRYQEQFMLLDIIDNRWLEHLREMDYLRSAVAFSGYAQKDPKIEYKKRGLENFIEMLGLVENHFTERFFKFRLSDEAFERAKLSLSDKWDSSQDAQKEEVGSILASATAPQGDDARSQMNKAVNTDQGGDRKMQPIVRDHRKVGRNEVVTIQKGNTKQLMKYKKAEHLIENEGWRIIDE